MSVANFLDIAYGRWYKENPIADVKFDLIEDQGHKGQVVTSPIKDEDDHYVGTVIMDPLHQKVTISDAKTCKSVTLTARNYTDEYGSRRRTLVADGELDAQIDVGKFEAPAASLWSGDDNFDAKVTVGGRDLLIDVENPLFETTNDISVLTGDGVKHSFSMTGSYDPNDEGTAGTVRCDYVTQKPGDSYAEDAVIYERYDPPPKKSNLFSDLARIFLSMYA